MLTIRLQRIGKIHRPEYRLVLAEKSRSVSKLAQKVFGHYNPTTKKLTLSEKEALQKYVDFNVEMSQTVQSLLKKNGIERATKQKTAAKKPAQDKKGEKTTKKSTKTVAKKS